MKKQSWLWSNVASYMRQPLTPAKVTTELTFMFFMVHSKEKGSTTERLRRSSCAHKHGQRVGVEESGER